MFTVPQDIIEQIAEAVPYIMRNFPSSGADTWKEFVQSKNGEYYDVNFYYDETYHIVVYETGIDASGWRATKTQNPAVLYDNPFPPSKHDILLGMGTITKPVSTSQEVTVLRIAHRHGENWFICASPEAAQQKLRRYVTDWWDEELPDEHPLKGKATDTRVMQYFTLVDEEYSIETVSVIQEEGE